MKSIVTEYNIFMCDELKKQKKNNPELTNKEIMRLATVEWKKIKDIKMINRELTVDQLASEIDKKLFINSS